MVEEEEEEEEEEQVRRIAQPQGDLIAALMTEAHALIVLRCQVHNHQNGVENVFSCQTGQIELNGQ